MRIMGFSKKWGKLNHQTFSTFRLPRKDRDWYIGEPIQVVYHPRSKDHKLLFLAEIINVEHRSFDPASAPLITNAEAIADGFDSVNSMRLWLEQAHGKFNVSRLFNKITLRHIEDIKYSPDCLKGEGR